MVCRVKLGNGFGIFSLEIHNNVMTNELILMLKKNIFPKTKNKKEYSVTRKLLSLASLRARQLLASHRTESESAPFAKRKWDGLQKGFACAMKRNLKRNENRNLFLIRRWFRKSTLISVSEYFNLVRKRVTTYQK